VSLANGRVRRSFLYAPGADERKLRKALRSGADAVVFDLEDSVAPSMKEAARNTVARVLADVGSVAECEIHVRVNHRPDGFDMADLAMAVHPNVSALRLPKCERPEDIREVERVLDELERATAIEAGSIRLYPTIESAAGVGAAAEILGAGRRVQAGVFGPADFAASIGLFDATFEATLFARSALVLASSRVRVQSPVDGAYLRVRDLDGLRDESRRVRHLGFVGKSAIHPAQVPVLHEVFTPTQAEVDRAREVVDLAAAKLTGVVDGEYVDPPVVAQARTILQLAAHLDQEDGDYG
jgi:citrate lyase subunit beta / citryl-CoA lyase